MDFSGEQPQYGVYRMLTHVTRYIHLARPKYFITGVIVIVARKVCAVSGHIYVQ
jgi:hypothetical protein